MMYDNICFIYLGFSVINMDNLKLVLMEKTKKCIGFKPKTIKKKKKIITGFKTVFQKKSKRFQS